MPIAVPYAIIVTLILCDLFGTGFLFSVTEQNVYHRGSLIIIQYITLLYYYSLSLLVALTAGKQNNHARFFPVHIFVFPCIIGTLIQIFNYGLAVGWLFVSIAFQFIQSYLFNQNSFIDDLTGLYNRKYYNCVTDKLAKSKKQKNIAGVMMDVDQFKSINDELSHSVGDDAIKSIGKLLTEITSRKTMAFRYAGDEFIIISTDVKERDVICMMEAFATKVESFNNSAGKPYKLSLSMGYALCDTVSFKPNVFLHQMDKKMYEAKTQYYAENNIPRTPHYVTIDLSSTESEG